MALEQSVDLEFRRGVEAAMTLGDLLRKQTIGADDVRAAFLSVSGRVIDDQQMIADRIEGIDVAAGETRFGVRDRGAFLVEDAIAKPLRAAHFRRVAREPHFQRAEPAERFVRRE